MKRKLLLSLAIALACLSSTYAAAFTFGNIVVTRVGSTAAAVSANGSLVYLDEYTTAGVFVQTVACPANFMGYNSAETSLTSSSLDGQYLTLSGITSAVQITGGINNSSAELAPRCIARIKYDGTVDVFTPTVTASAGTATKCAATMGNANVTIATANAFTGTIAVGQRVFGNGMPMGVSVATVTGSPVTAFTLSANALNTSTAPLTFMTDNTPIFSNLVAPKAVFTTNGSDFWMSGIETLGYYYNPTLNGGVPTHIANNASRYYTAIDGKLYGVNNYGSLLYSFGADNVFPTTPTAATTAVTATQPTYNTGSVAPNNGYGICGVDVSATIPGIDVYYVAALGNSDVYGVLKYSKGLDGNWTKNTGIGVPGDYYISVTAKVTNVATGEVTIWAVRSKSGLSQLVQIVDASGYNANMSATPTILQAYNQATSPLGGAWRSVNFVPSNMPGVPTTVVATAGNGQATVTFSAPASNGGSAITLYTVTSNPDGKTATGNTTSPIIVAGLTNETTYTFTVTAANMNGTGESSIASSAVTPSITSLLIDSKSQQIRLFPNPVADVLYINFAALKQSETVKIYSMNGKLLSTQDVAAGSSEAKLNVANFQQGLYMVKFAGSVSKFKKKSFNQ